MRSTASVSKLRFIVLEQRHYSRWCSHGIDTELDRESKSTWREIDYCDKIQRHLSGEEKSIHRNPEQEQMQ